MNKQFYVGITASTGESYFVMNVFNPQLYYIDCIEMRLLQKYKNLYKSDTTLTGNSVQKVDGIYLVEKPNDIGGLWCSLSRNKNFLFKTLIKTDATMSDGFAIVLQSENNKFIGTKAGGKGYDGIKHGIALEFSLFSRKELRDPLFQHIAVMVSGSEGLTGIHDDSCIHCVENPPCFWDTNVHEIKVFFNQSDIVLWFDSLYCFKITHPIIETLIKQKSYIGITSSNNELHNSCIIKSCGVLYD